MPKYIEELVSQQVHRSELAKMKLLETGEICPRPVVTMSRRMGSGARIVAQKLAHDLGWSLWDKELINAIAEDADVSRRVVEALDEKAISDIEALARSILGNREIGEFLYKKHLTRALASIAKLGNAIILGRGANFVLLDALSVRIDASDARRTLNMMSYENLSRTEAEAKIRESDKERAHFLASTYGKERVKEVHYDLSIWMDRFSTDDAVELIKQAVRIWCRNLPWTAPSR
jgi:cytidylate kinase